MTIDERLEFLLQSTESLHSNTQVMQASIQVMQASIQSLQVTAAQQSEQFAKVIKAMEITDHRFRELATTVGEIAVAVLNRERRLGKLDGAQDVS